MSAIEGSEGPKIEKDQTRKCSVPPAKSVATIQLAIILSRQSNYNMVAFLLQVVFVKGGLFICGFLEHGLLQKMASVFMRKIMAKELSGSG